MTIVKEISNYLAKHDLGTLDGLVKCMNSNYIYGVIAWRDGEYRCWTHYNTELHSMNCGHYGFASVNECLDVFDEVYGKNGWKWISTYGWKPVLFDERITDIDGNESVLVCGHYRCVAFLHDTAVAYYGVKKVLDLCEPLFFAIKDKSKKNLLNEPSITDDIFCLCQKYQDEIISGVSVAVILNHAVLRKIEKLIGAFYLLPSSRFEWIVVPVIADATPEDLTLLVQSCNADEKIVRHEDVLSDQVLLFENGQLSVAVKEK